MVEVSPEIEIGAPSAVSTVSSSSEFSPSPSVSFESSSFSSPAENSFSSPSILSEIRTISSLDALGTPLSVASPESTDEMVRGSDWILPTPQATDHVEIRGQLEPVDMFSLPAHTVGSDRFLSESVVPNFRGGDWLVEAQMDIHGEIPIPEGLVTESLVDIQANPAEPEGLTQELALSQKAELPAAKIQELGDMKVSEAAAAGESITQEVSPVTEILPEIGDLPKLIAVESPSDTELVGGSEALKDEVVMIPTVIQDQALENVLLEDPEVAPQKLAAQVKEALAKEKAVGTLPKTGTIVFIPEYRTTKLAPVANATISNLQIAKARQQLAAEESLDPNLLEDSLLVSIIQSHLPAETNEKQAQRVKILKREPIFRIQRDDWAYNNRWEAIKNAILHASTLTGRAIVEGLGEDTPDRKSRILPNEYMDDGSNLAVRKALLRYDKFNSLDEALARAWAVHEAHPNVEIVTDSVITNALSSENVEEVLNPQRQQLNAQLQEARAAHNLTLSPAA